MIRFKSTREWFATLGEPSRIVNCRWRDPWHGNRMTEEEARKQSHHAAKLFREAMTATRTEKESLT